MPKGQAEKPETTEFRNDDKATVGDTQKRKVVEIKESATEGIELDHSLELTAGIQRAGRGKLREKLHDMEDVRSNLERTFSQGRENREMRSDR